MDNWAYTLIGIIVWDIIRSIGIIYLTSYKVKKDIKNEQTKTFDNSGIID